MSSRALLSLLVASAALSACGSETGSDAGGGSAPSSEPSTQLEVEFRPNGNEAVVITAVLTCDPPGGDHPRAGEACAALEAHADALRPVPGDVACTEIYGGPETAAVTGTFQGSRVEARFNRTNGCEISRWDALEPLLRLRD